jgi:hypothetical protein
MSTPPPYPEPTQPALPYETPRSQWNATSIGAIALKILGVYCVIETLQIMHYLMYSPWAGGGRSIGLETLAILAGFGLYLGFAAALIFFAGPIARWLFRDEQTHAAATDLPVGPYLQAVALSIVGVWVTVEGVGAIVFQIGYRLTARGSFSAWDIAQPGTKTVLGICLILGGPGLARLWHKLRTAGTVHGDVG